MILLLVAAPVLGDEVTSGGIAAAANESGLNARQSGDLDGAIEHFRRAVHLASSKTEATRYQLNLSRGLLETGNLPALLEELQNLDRRLDEDKETAQHAEFRVAMSDLYRKAVTQLYAEPSNRLLAYQQLEKAEKVAADDDAWLLSYIDGYRAALYLDERRPEPALLFARRAVNQAQRLQSPDPLFRWEWLVAQALVLLGRTEPALEAYERASENLQKVRRQLEQNEQALAQTVRPLLLEYADLLLKKAARTVGATQQNHLAQARNVLETIKVAEVEDYFQTPCVVSNPGTENQLPEGSAIIYPVILDDRIELIVSKGDSLFNVATPVNRNQLTATIRDFRLNLQVDTATLDYLRQGQQLFNWLIKPLENHLTEQQINTLVIIPDGPLRTIPLSALHDGNQFLVERFALATLPGLTFFESRPLQGRENLVFAGGLSESVQGFDALPGVENELNSIESVFPAQTLRNESFTKAALERELSVGDHRIVHLATHGQFRSSYSQSYLLTYDQKLQMDELGGALRKRSQSNGALDLLVLSACESAAGDDRAALGLAGVAIRSGARSALATLWEVDDQSTQLLIKAFYEGLAQPAPPSKADSLRRAQQILISQAETRHPSQWAPFLLIGDWL